MEERARRNVEVAMERRVARIMEPRKETEWWKLLREICWNVGEDLERLEFSIDSVFRTLFRINSLFRVRVLRCHHVYVDTVKYDDGPW